MKSNAALIWLAIFLFFGLGILHADEATAPSDVPTFLLAWGQKGDKDGEFYSPIEIAIDKNDIVFVTDLNNARVQKFTTDGKHLGGFNLPLDTPPRKSCIIGGMAIDEQGQVYLSFMNQHKLAVYTASGELVREWGKQGQGDGEFNQPGGIVLYPDGTVYVTDQCNHRIQKFSTDGKSLAKFGEYGTQPGQFGGALPAGTRFGGPHFLSMDRQGRLYTTEGAVGRVQQLSPDGRPLAAWGDKGDQPGGFGGYQLPGLTSTVGPIGVFVDKSDRVWVSSLNDRVQAFSTEGKLLFSLGGSGHEPGQFARPHGMAMDSQGCLYVADAGNQRIQKFALPAVAATSALPDNHFNERIRPFLAAHCLECHAGEQPKGEFALDMLSPGFDDEKSRERWLAVLGRIEAGEMPPKEKPRPPQEDVQALADWIRGGVESAEAAGRAAQGRVVLRRLNRVEYENTVRDLLGVNVDVKELLPVDSSANGFDNVGEALHTSSFLMERYLEAAEAALNVAIANGPQPPLLKKRYFLKNQHQVKSTTERVFRHLDDTVVLFSSSLWQTVMLYELYEPYGGQYRFRISTYGFQSAGKPVTFRVDAGAMGMVGKTHLVGYFDAPPDKPAVIDFVDQLLPRNTIAILPYGLAGAQEVDKIGADTYEGKGLAIEWVEVEGPMQDSWPPESHRRIFGELAQAPDASNRERVEVVSQDPLADARRILGDFARRAFRRAVTGDDVEPLVALVEQKLADGYSFEQAVRVGLAGVLVSPEFLYLREKPGTLDDFALASRLSYFLWSTMPDEELLALAEAGKLGVPDVLRGQVERMLASPKAAAFTKNFVGQWLGLRDIDFTEPGHILYPEFDQMLKASMVPETELFFAEVLKNDLSVANFVASDFTVLNGRLAKHYGIPGIDGWEFRKVSLPPESHRGGVLTMASVLKVTANGTSTSPVIRGAWVLDRILGTPPQPPPAGVAALEPDIRGATTIREQLARHRATTSCASCHTKIDPPGFALESFDVIGGWRDFYRTTGNGDEVIVDGQRMPYHKGREIDPSAEFQGQPFNNIDELKRLLLNDKEQLARSLTVKLLTYATGGAPQSADQAEIEAIVDKIREKDYGLRTLIHEIVQSKLFRNK